jgi:hypothetical protein
VLGVADAVTDGGELTVTVVVACEEHPLISVPTTVYVVVDIGDSVTGVPT